MSSSPNSRLVQRTIELNYMNKKRSNAFKWILVNAVFLLVFVYDLSYKCPGYTSVLHYVELICAVMMAANLVQYAICLVPSRAPKLPLSPDQQKILGLSNADLDSSFILNKSNTSMGKVSDTEGENWAVSDAELSLSPRTWRSPPPSPPSRTSSPAPSPPASPPRLAQLDSYDQFISDRNSLEVYLRRWSERAQAEQSPPPPPAAARLAGPAPLYQLATATTETGHRTLEESNEAGGAAGLVWWRLDLDPQRLTQWNLNLRLWIHVTILSRLVREVRAADDALARLALCEAGALREGRVPPARLRAAPATAQLLPFLEPFPDQRYLVRRITELAAGGCISAYKWDGGGSEWDASKPTDAELVLHLFATYLDGQLPGGASARPFSGVHVVERSTAAQRRPDTLAIVVVGPRPPHYALALGEETLEVGRGRNNLLHTLLLFLAAAARRDPPALARTHLGPAGLNMLWIIGR